MSATLLNITQQLPCLPEQILYLAALFSCLGRMTPVFKRIFVSTWCARAMCTTMHAAPFFALDRW